MKLFCRHKYRWIPNGIEIQCVCRRCGKMKSVVRRNQRYKCIKVGKGG
ncbi:MAG: hypothetical protein IKW21_02440 [Lachnospiraceae bacterium]|nr:hypothetical protein [Lachnospiraceae bacterium]